MHVVAYRLVRLMRYSREKKTVFVRIFLWICGDDNKCMDDNDKHVINHQLLQFLNQVHAGHRPVHTWFLKIVSVRMSVCMCMCVRPEAIDN